MRTSWLLLVIALVLDLAIPARAADSPDLPVSGSANSNLASFDRLMIDFVREHQAPGAALAVTRHGQLVYARGFGFADQERREPVKPQALFRIASISKPFTSAAVMQLVERGMLRLEDHPFEVLGLKPVAGEQMDPRLRQITILQLLQHTGGFDRDKSFDPMFRSIAIARELKTNPPASQEAIIRYMLGRPLDFDPGTREAYSNFGYCVLGRVIEKVSGESYEQFVRQHVLAPLNVHDMRLGHTLASLRAPSEVMYYDEKNRTGGSVFPPRLGQQVPLPYGAWDIEAMDSHGGWIASALDLVRFASSFDDSAHSKILSERSIKTIFAPPAGEVGHNPDRKIKAVYYGCGWQVRQVGGGRINTWHNGSLDGTSTLLVRRADGLCWAVLFNTRKDQNGKELAGIIDPPVHKAADEVKQWPQADLFERYLSSEKNW